MRIGAVARLELRMERWLFVTDFVVSHFSLAVLFDFSRAPQSTRPSDHARGCGLLREITVLFQNFQSSPVSGHRLIAKLQINDFKSSTPLRYVSRRVSAIDARYWLRVSAV
jgi:hypothetical protein